MLVLQMVLEAICLKIRLSKVDQQKSNIITIFVNSK